MFRKFSCRLPILLIGSRHENFVKADTIWLSLTKLGERAFSYTGPAAWSALPASLHDITDTGKFKKIA